MASFSWVTWVTLPALSRYLPSTTATSLRCRRSCPLIVRWAARKAAVWGIPSPLSPHLPFPFFSSPQRLRLGHRPKSLRRGRIRSGEAPICVVVVQIYALLARLGRLRWGLSVLDSGRADGDGGLPGCAVAVAASRSAPAAAGRAEPCDGTRSMRRRRLSWSACGATLRLHGGAVGRRRGPAISAPSAPRVWGAHGSGFDGG